MVVTGGATTALVVSAAVESVLVFFSVSAPGAGNQ